MSRGGEKVGDGERMERDIYREIAREIERGGK